ELTTVGGGSDASRVNVTFRDAPGSSIPANTRCLILQQSAFVAVGGALRFYPLVMSVARQGAPLFNNPASFSIISTVEPLPGESEAKPFGYSSAARRLLSVNLRNRSSKYSHRVSDFSSFFNIRSSIAIKSTYLDPLKLKAIN
ncbi:MAG TPA: hypothetical protein VFV83_05570, partial [Chthoniobacteraceae bacterium]|nr:hypothetical protein [Chthoniobacteraceae bacterium]